jgi:hypothetical protein
MTGSDNMNREDGLWWDDIDTEKLPICPPLLSGNPNSGVSL